MKFLWEIFVLSPSKRKKIRGSREKKRCLEVLKMKAEIALLSRHAAPVAQGTSVLDF